MKQLHFEMLEHSRFRREKKMIELDKEMIARVVESMAQAIVAVHRSAREESDER